MNLSLPRPARWPAAAGAAAAVTFAVFFVMQLLIATGENPLSEEIQGRVIDFVKIEQPEEVQTRDRKPERPPAPEKPPDTPDIPQQQIAQSDLSQSLSISGAVSADIDLDVRSGLDGAAADGEYLPIVKVAPVYPQRALSRGIEGWVLVEFTVTPSGSVRDPVVVDADPKGYFEQAATDAALKFRYKPRMIDGKGVEVAGVQNLIRFTLER